MNEKRKTAARALEIEAPRQSLRDEQRMVARDRILSAAVRTFVENGYQSTTIDDITTLAGMSRATFYLYFKNKVEIIAALVDQSMVEFKAIYLSIPIGAEPEGKKIRAWLDSLFDYYDRTRDRVTVYRQAQTINPDIQRMADASYQAIIDELCAREMLGRASPDGAVGKQLRTRLRLYMSLIDSACYLSVIAKSMDKIAARNELARVWPSFLPRASGDGH